MSAALPKGSHGAPYLWARPAPRLHAEGVYRVYLNDCAYTLVDEVDVEDIGQFAWRLGVRSDGAGHYAVRAYAASLNGRSRSVTEYLHRRITKAPAGTFVDHADGNMLNNCRSNLRICTARENSRNRTKNGNSRYPYKGIYSRNGYWYARIKLNGREVHLGSYASAVEAAIAYDRAAVEHFAEFALLNFPHGEPCGDRLCAGDPSLSTAVDHLPVLRSLPTSSHPSASVASIFLKHGGLTGCGQSQETVA